MAIDQTKKGASPGKKVERIFLFTFLEENNICHAVGCNVQTIRLKTIQETARQWFVLVSVKDAEAVAGYKFKRSKDRADTLEYDIWGGEVDHFKEVQEAEYVKVLHTKDGRIYEQKKQSFSQKLDHE